MTPPRCTAMDIPLDKEPRTRHGCDGVAERLTWRTKQPTTTSACPPAREAKTWERGGGTARGETGGKQDGGGRQAGGGVVLLGHAHGGQERHGEGQGGGTRRDGV